VLQLIYYLKGKIMKNAVGYVRVSTAEQAKKGISIKKVLKNWFSNSF